MKLKRGFKSRLFRSAAALMACVFFFYCWFRVQPFDDGSWDQVQDAGVLHIGMDASYPPFSDIRDNQPVGLDVDLANEIGGRLGVRVEIVNMGYDGLYEALRAGQVDALISALSVDPTKIGNVLYSQMYLNAGQVIGSQSGQFHLMNDLEGQTVAVEYGSVGDELVRLWQRRLHEIKVVRFTTSDEAMQAVLDGKADAVIVDVVTGRLFTRNHPGLLLSDTRVKGDPYCVVVRIVSPKLNGAINYAIRAMQQEGVLQEIVNRWLS